MEKFNHHRYPIDVASIDETSAPRRRFGFVFLVYQQIGSVLAAVGLAVLLGHFVQLDWRSILASLIGIWDEYVRGFTQWLFHILVSVPLRWIHVDFEVPVTVRDYLAVGILFALSFARAFLGRNRSAFVSKATFRGILRRVFNPFALGFASAAVALWPLVLCYCLLGAFGGGRTYSYRSVVSDGGVEREVDSYELTEFSPTIALLSLSPLAYLAILLAANYWVLRTGN